MHEDATDNRHLFAPFTNGVRLRPPAAFAYGPTPKSKIWLAPAPPI